MFHFVQTQHCSQMNAVLKRVHTFVPYQGWRSLGYIICQQSCELNQSPVYTVNYPASNHQKMSLINTCRQCISAPQRVAPVLRNQQSAIPIIRRTQLSLHSRDKFQIFKFILNGFICVISRIFPSATLSLILNAIFG